MMKLKEALLATAVAAATHEGAATAIAEPDCTLDLCGDVSRARRMIPAFTRTVRGSKLLLS
jgi:hypothetical protein